MNWRTLFRWLATIITLLFAGVWGCSLWYRLSINHGHGKLTLFVERGTVGARSSEHHRIQFMGGGWPLFSLNRKSPFYPAGRPKYGAIQIYGTLSVQHTPAAPTPIAGPLGTWRHERARVIHKSLPGMIPMYRPGEEPYSILDTFYFPLWFPWLTAVAAAFVFCRLMERRSSVGKEKELAGETDRDRVAD